MSRQISGGKGFLLLIAGVFVLVGLQGCVATRDWVSEQLTPISGRVSEGESRLGKMDSRFSEVEGRLGQIDTRFSDVEGRIGKVDAKADKALNALANLRLEKKLVLSFKEGANFGFDSSALTEASKREIDSLFSDLKGDLKGKESALFLVAGHTDSVGTENYNYELGKKRADSVARYLITRKSVDPLKVIAVSYGKSSPMADNRSKEGRQKNRRVEILVYQEGISTAPAEAAQAPQGAGGSAAETSQRLSSR